MLKKGLYFTMLFNKIYRLHLTYKVPLETNVSTCFGLIAKALLKCMKASGKFPLA